MSEGDLYAGREQTLVKHYILEHYLERFAHIVGSAWDAITYVDCFSGPWNARSERLEDSSFALALRQLKAAHEPRGPEVRTKASATGDSLFLFGERRRRVRQAR